MILDEICAHKRTEVETSKKSVPLSALKQRIAEISPARDFRAALRTPGISLIAEVKKASPSKGVLRAISILWTWADSTNGQGPAQSPF